MEQKTKQHNRNTFILGILFVLFLGIYLLLKSVNEISQNAIEYIGNLNEILLVVVVAGICYYLYSFYIAKNDRGWDLLRVNESMSKIHPFIRFLINITISFFAVVAIAYIVFYKTLYWQGGEFVVLFASLLCFVVIMSSLTLES